MPLTFDQKIALFHRTNIQQMRNVGLSAYLIRQDGSIIRFRPDGKREYIVSGSAFAARLTSEAQALAQN